MHLEVVSPEAILFRADVDSITVPGMSGEFQMLDNHAPIVSTLKEGTVKIHVHAKDQSVLNNLNEKVVPKSDDSKVLTIAIQSGTLELKDNKAIILVD